MVPVEQTVFARWLEWGTRVGLWLLIAAFAAYTFGVLEPQVALSRLPALWGLPADRYQAMAGAPAGWRWLGFLDKGDYLNLLAAMILAQIGVLLAAASGALAGGH